MYVVVFFFESRVIGRSFWWLMGFVFRVYIVFFFRWGFERVVFWVGIRVVGKWLELKWFWRCVGVWV